MKKLALVLTFAFGVAMIAPAFAADPVKKAEVKKECTKDGKACAKDCTKACCSKDAKAGEKKDAPAPKK
jgi:hypothetical protein